MGEREVLAAKRAHLELRARVLHRARKFFLDEGFLEVQTPLLASELAPERHIEPTPAGEKGALSTSPELYMKRLLAAGYEKIFQIAPAFRSAERGRLHHPEFTLLEWYRTGVDYSALQDDCRELLVAISRCIGRHSGWFFQKRWLEVEGEWHCLTVREAFRQFAGWDPVMEADENRFDLDLVEKVEPPSRLSPALHLDRLPGKPGSPCPAETRRPLGGGAIRTLLGRHRIGQWFQ